MQKPLLHRAAFATQPNFGTKKDVFLRTFSVKPKEKNTLCPAKRDKMGFSFGLESAIPQISYHKKQYKKVGNFIYLWMRFYNR